MSAATAPRRATGGEDELEVVRSRHGDLELAFLPAVGGRLISLRCGRAELLWQNPDYLDTKLRTVRPRSTWAPLDGSMGSWANVGGSKTWPAPQGWDGRGQWPGPPDDVLDSGRWTISEHRSAEGRLTVTLASPDDSRTGLRIEREFDVPAAGRSFRQRNTFTNVSDRPIRWSIWEVCQVDTSMFATAPGGLIAVEASGAAGPTSMLEADGHVAVGPARGGIRSVEVSDVVAKVGFTDATGSIRFQRPDGAGLEIGFPVDEDAVYPDGGCRVELWMQYPTVAPLSSLGGLHPSARLVELEVLSPLADLDPGASFSQDLSWSAWPPTNAVTIL